jgi:hypothetical protein
MVSPGTRFVEQPSRPARTITRSSIRWLCVLLVGMSARPAAGHTQTGFQIGEQDRVRLAEARRLADRLGERLWPGWGRTPFPVLLVGDSTEVLVGHSRPTGDFVRLADDPALGGEVRARPRRFSPTLLATFPAVGGIPTVVVGSAGATGKSSTAWVLTLLHEHFHQWQYSQPDYYPGVSRLDLAQGDTTGQWMLDYPFPYDSAPVQRAMRSLAAALARALEAQPNDRRVALGNAVAARDTLRSRLTDADYRYLEFQLWQEGTARFIEYAAARAAAGAGQPSAAFRMLPDYESYDTAAERARRTLQRELEQLDLPRQRRIAFYPVGAAVAMVLDRTRPDWKRAYGRRPFALAALLSADP